MKSKILFISVSIFTHFFHCWMNAADPPNHPYRDAVGKNVTVCGIGWGRYDKGVGIHIMTPEGVPIYLGSAATKDELRARFEQWQGRLIEVTGVLKEVKSGTGTFRYLVIEELKIRRLNKIRREFFTTKKPSQDEQPAKKTKGIDEI